MILYIICTGGVRGEGFAEASAVFVVLGKATNRLKKWEDRLEGCYCLILWLV